jgi:hydroxyacyl-ACP dehydratase HTD2-like protein with hotdog domain
MVNPVLLFRFSALTYNSHRIHYDREYARDVEGYASRVAVQDATGRRTASGTIGKYLE